MTELNEQEMALLKVLADEWDNSGPLCFLETAAIAKALEITVPEGYEAARNRHPLPPQRLFSETYKLANVPQIRLEWLPASRAAYFP